MLSYGLTAHKAQCETYEQMIAHISKPPGHCKIYSCGQIYTMLSQAKTRQGLKIVGLILEQLLLTKCSYTNEKASGRQTFSNQMSFHCFLTKLQFNTSPKCKITWQKTMMTYRYFYVTNRLMFFVKQKPMFRITTNSNSKGLMYSLVKIKMVVLYTHQKL